MKLRHNMGEKNIREALSVQPMIGEILARYGIGCTGCTIGTCLLKDVVAVHCLGDETEKAIEQEINACLETL